MNKRAILAMKKLRDFQLGQQQHLLRKKNDDEIRRQKHYSRALLRLQESYLLCQVIKKAGDGVWRDLNVGATVESGEAARLHWETSRQERFAQLRSTLLAKQRLDLTERLLRRQAERENQELDQRERREMDDAAQSQFHLLGRRTP